MDPAGGGFEDIRAQARPGFAPAAEELAFGDEIDGDVIVENANVRMVADPGEKRLLDRPTREVVRMEDAALPVAAFTVQVEDFGRVSVRASARCG